MELAVETFRMHVVLHSLLVQSCIGSSSRIVVSPTRRFAYPANTRNADTRPHDRHPQEHGGLQVLSNSQSGTQMVGAHTIRALARCVPCPSRRLHPIFQIAGLLPYLAYISQLKAGLCYAAALPLFTAPVQLPLSLMRGLFVLPDDAHHLVFWGAVDLVSRFPSLRD